MIAVTGVAGTVAAYIVAELIKRGKSVLALGRTTGLPEWVALAPKTVFVDLSKELHELESYRGKIECIVHCAATSSPPEKAFETLFTDNVRATENLTQWAVANGTRKFIFFGAISSFGRVSTPLVSPETPDVAPDSYGETKRLAENVVRQCAGLQQSMVMRIPGVLGRGATRAFLPRALATARSGETIHASNPDAFFNNAVHAAHLARFVADIVDRQDLPAFDFLTLGSAEPMQVRDVLQEIVSKAGARSCVEFDLEDRQPFMIDSSRARDIYGYEPATMRSTLTQWLNEVL